MTDRESPGPVVDPSGQASAQLPPDWPHRWAADVVLADGGTAHLRPIEPGDADRLRIFHAALSPETIYYRFFAPYPRLSEKDVTRFTRVDQVWRGALVALLGDEIVGVARWEGGGPDQAPAEAPGGLAVPAEAPGRLAVPAEAEVAFVVRDDQQGRGLGSVLLEHLAAAGRERGVERFTADVLPDNRQMVKVFLDAGYGAERAYTDGVVRLSFAIEPTTQSLDVSQAREHRSESASVARLLSPRSVAVVGASRDTGTEGYVLLRNLLVGGFEGPVYPVNPATGWVASIPAFSRLGDVPGRVDLAVVAVPAAAVPQVVAEAADAGVHGLVVVSSGFGEAGPDGAAAERELVRLARSQGMRVVGPNCLGVINTDPAVSLNASLVPDMPARGSIGFFSQSGALGIQILSSLNRRGLGLSTFVSAGNRADVSGNDLLQYWEDDPATEVVLMYLESFGNPRKFARLARRVARRKPVVVVKSRGVPQGHSRGVAVPATTADALFAQAGVIRVDTVEQLFDTAQLLALQPLPVGDRVAVVGNSSALSRLAADECVAQGLELAEPGERVRQVVEDLLGPQAPANPVDLGPRAGAQDLARVLAAVRDDPGVDAVVVVYIPALRTAGEDVADVLRAAGSDDRVPVAAAFLGELGVPAGLRVTVDGVLARGSVPSYVSPEAAVRALARARRYARWRARPTGDLRLFDDLDLEAATELLVDRLAADPHGVDLDEPTTRRLLALLGLPVWEQAPAGDVEAAQAHADRLGWPVALKSTDASRRHRSDLGGVRLDLGSAAELQAAWSVVAGADGAVVQAMAPVGVATVVGLTEDPSFGPVISVAVGGVAGELLGDRTYRTVPLTDVDAAEMLADLRAAPLLAGWRGAEPVHLPSLQELLQRVAAVGEHLPQVVDLELNPVVAHGHGLTVLGARIRVAAPTIARGPGPRRMR